MILFYVDDILLTSHDIAPLMQTLGTLDRLKEDKHGEPDCYLGANIAKLSIGDIVLFSMKCNDYVKTLITNLEQMDM